MTDPTGLAHLEKKMEEIKEKHKTDGAIRDHRPPAYRLIPAVLMKWTGEAFSEGAGQYNEGLWETNWKKGDSRFYAEAFDHVVEHLYTWWTLKTDPALAEVLGYKRDENHLGHAAAGLGFLVYGEVMGFFNEARDPSAPGYQYPFVPEDIPPELEEQPTISELIEKGTTEEEVTEGTTVSDIAIALEKESPGWFEGLVKKVSGGNKLKPAE